MKDDGSGIMDYETLPQEIKVSLCPVVPDTQNQLLRRGTGQD
jgi:hypothetical protein